MAISAPRIEIGTSASGNIATGSDSKGWKNFNVAGAIMLPDALTETLRLMWTTFRAANVPIAVMGGIALSRWERIRATKDIDLLVGIELANIDSLLKALRVAGANCEHQPPVRNIGKMQFIQLCFEPRDSFIEVRVDLLLATTQFLNEALRRRVPMQVPNAELAVEVVTCEDLILLKLQAGRIIDRADAAELLWLNRPTLDLDYLVRWIEKIHLEAEWQQVWSEAFPDETPPRRE